jgi:hypothetical protein
MTRREWAPILDVARGIVESYSYRITLRQLHYRLVMTAGLGYANALGDYKQLSSLTAEGRRGGTFPALLDQTHTIEGGGGFLSPTEALSWLAARYTRLRDEGQQWLVVLGGEKATLLAQLRQWFGPLGVRIVLLRGYGSQTYVDDVAAMVDDDVRPAVLVYAGDFDASGEDILRDFLDRCPVFSKVERVAVNAEQLDALALVVNPGKPEDARADAFIARHADLHDTHDFGRDRLGRRIPVQVEVEAIAPTCCAASTRTRSMATGDASVYDSVLVEERVERGRLTALAEREDDG